MNKQDENELTENWHSDTNYLNEKIDDFFKRAQDHAYALGLARGLKEAAVAPASPLSDEQLLEILGDIDADTKPLPPGVKAFARAIEAHHGIKEKP